MYRLTAMLEFEDEAQALDAYNQLSARATNTIVVGMNTIQAHTSYARVENTETKALLQQFYVDIFGIVRQGVYIPPTNMYPVWVQPTGAQDSYPILDEGGNPTRVEHNGENWENTSGTVNSWEPGAFGWTSLGVV